MRKTDNKDYRSYIIATAKPTEQLDEINRLGGRIYSKTVSLAFKTHAQKGFWISEGGLKKYLKFKDYPCHAHSVQAVINDYCGARRSFFANRKSNPHAKPPNKTCKFHTFTWRAIGISYKRGKLRLSMGKGRDPLWIKIDKKFHKKVPAEVSLVYNKTTKQYEFHATYLIQPKKTKTKAGSAVAVDMGEIHPITTFATSDKAEIYISFSPDSRTIASGSWDTTVRLWDTVTGEHLKTLTGHTTFVVGVDFSPDGLTIASGGDTGAIFLWDAPSVE